jgi:hypothetical protein
MSNIDQLRDEQVLRREIGMVLNPGWGHEHCYIMNDTHWPDGAILTDPPKNDRWPKASCWKCNAVAQLQSDDELTTAMWERLDITPCPIPDPFTGDLAIAAELLLRKCDKSKLFYAIERFLRATGHKIPEDTGGYWEWFVYANPADRCIVCLMALDPQPEEKP